MENSKKMYSEQVKRMLDFIISFLFIIILMPAIIILWLAVYFSSGNPVIFKQKRIGQNGKEFFIYKFRTMVKDAEKIGPTSTSNNDCRITKIGNILRKTSLDELPQLFNILKGEMSFIGYRPGVKKDYDLENESDIFAVKPGLTGYAQINGRSSLSYEEKRKWERKYIKEISFYTDLKIFVKTILVVLNRKGTN